MITKRDFILRGSCFCQKYRCTVYTVQRTVYTVHVKRIVCLKFLSLFCGDIRGGKRITPHYVISFWRCRNVSMVLLS